MNKIKKMRTEKGYTINGLAKRAGLDHSTILLYEGKNDNKYLQTMSITNVLKLCLALDCTMEDLLEDGSLNLLMEYKSKFCL